MLKLNSITNYFNSMQFSLIPRFLRFHNVHKYRNKIVNYLQLFMERTIKFSKLTAKI